MLILALRTQEQFTFFFLFAHWHWVKWNCGDFFMWCFLWQLNIMCFMAELLNWFEVQKPDFVQPSLTLDLTGITQTHTCTHEHKHTHTWTHRHQYPSNWMLIYTCVLRCFWSGWLYEPHEWEQQQVKYCQCLQKCTSCGWTCRAKYMWITLHLPSFAFIRLDDTHSKGLSKGRSQLSRETVNIREKNVANMKQSCF